MTDRKAADLQAAAVWVVLALLIPPLLARFVVPHLTADVRFLAAMAVYGLAMLLMGIGCGFVARAKGYSPLLGILGVAFIIGLLVVAVLPNRRKVN